MFICINNFDYYVLQINIGHKVVRVPVIRVNCHSSLFFFNFTLTTTLLVSQSSAQNRNDSSCTKNSYFEVNSTEMFDIILK